MEHYLLTFKDCVGHTTQVAAAAAFVRRVTGVDVAFEKCAESGMWVASLPPGWVCVVANHGEGRTDGYWSTDDFEICTADDLTMAADRRADFAHDHPEPLPDDWNAPHNLWAVLQRYALIPLRNVHLVPELLSAKHMENGYPALALPDESTDEYEQRTGGLQLD